MTITRFSSFFVKVICSLLILTFSRISYTLTISQNNDTVPQAAVYFHDAHMLYYFSLRTAFRSG